jgi:4-amino-4-deoxy-L-arabinose transferase-like glycosyltransferase
LSAFGRYFAIASLKSGARNYVILFIGCVLFHMAGTWSLPLIDRDEPRFSEASREMIQRGNYIVPYFNDHFRLDKPPVTYWAQIASYKLFGENDFAARFPSAIAAALTAMAIFAWGSRIDGPRLGWWAAIIFSLSLQTFVHAKAAVADMWLVFFVTLAFWAGHELVGLGKNPPASAQSSTPKPSPWWWWTFYFGLAFAFLAKGPIGWTPLLTAESTKIFRRHFPLNHRFKFVSGILLMLAVVALWGIPALIQTHGEFFTIGIGRHVIKRSFGAMEGHGGNSLGVYLLLLPYYFVLVFFSFFPWSIKLPWLMKTLWRKRDNIDTYLLRRVAIIFLIFTFVKTKLPHYTLPAFPMLALLFTRSWIRSELSISLLKKLAIGMAAFCLTISLLLAPATARFFPSWNLYRQAKNDLQPSMEFAAADFTEPSLVWYFRSRVQGFMTTLNPRRAVGFMERPGPRFVVLPTDRKQEAFPNLPANWKTFSTRGFNIPKGKWVDLTLVLKPE